MKVPPHLLLLTVLFACPALAQTVGLYDRHVIFDNSVPEGGYEMSNSYLVAPQHS